MDNANRAKREQDFIFQQIEAMEERDRCVLLKMNQGRRDKVFMELVSSKPIWDLLRAVSPEAGREIIATCLRAWEDRITREEGQIGHGIA